MTDADFLPLIGETDVTVVGGGPSGASCALALRTHMPSLRVALVESSSYDVTRLGENVSSALPALLEYLDVKARFLKEAAHLENFSVKAYWGHDVAVPYYSLRHWSGEGYLLDRYRFDGMLAETFGERGGRLYLACKVEAIVSPEAGKSGYLLHLRHRSGKRFAMKTRFLVDATGRKASIARRLGAVSTRHDHLIGVSRFFAMDTDVPWSKDILIESRHDGWWYSAPLPENRLVVTWMTDNNLWRERDKLDIWENLLKQAPHTYTRLQQAAVAADFILTLRNAHTHILDNITGQDWLATGDAAASFDPLSSLGIGFAIHSGCHAARAIAGYLTGGENNSLIRYGESVKKQFADYLPTWQRYYHYEKRFTVSPFWQKRRYKDLYQGI